MRHTVWAALIVVFAAGTAYALSLPFSIIVTAPQTITTALLNNGTTGTFGSPAPPNAIVGPLSAVCSNSCSTITYTLSTAVPCDTTSGANNSAFTVVGTNLDVNVGTIAGTYNVCVVASSPAYTNQVAGKYTITGSTSTITSVLLNGGTTGIFPAPSSNLTTGTTEAGTLTATCSGSPCAGLTFAPSTTASGCNSTNGADNASFTIGTIPPIPPGTVLSDGSVMVQSGSSLNPIVGLAAGTYHVCVAASGAYPSSLGGAFTITGTTPTYPSSDGAVAVGGNGKIDTLFLNQITAASLGQSIVEVPQQWKYTGGTPDSCGYSRALNGKTLAGTSVAFEIYNNTTYAYNSCTSFGGPWWKYNYGSQQFSAIGNAAPTEASVPPQPIWMTFSAPACTNPITVPCKSTTGKFNIPDTTTSGTVLATVTVVNSDGSAFGGTLSGATTPFGISTYNIVAARNFTSGDDNTTFSSAIKAIPATQPSVSAVNLAPLNFMAQTGNAGSVVGLLTTTKGQTWGVAQPSYTLVTGCGSACADSALFTIDPNTNNLLIGASDITTVRSYAITVSDNEDGSNTPFSQAFTLNGVANTGTAGCPSLAPPAAQRAGLTTLVLCEDFSTAKYATLSNWMYCDSAENIHTFEWVSGSTLCNSTTFSQGTDPVTGKTVLHIFTPGGTGRIELATTIGPGAQAPNSGYGYDFPTDNYVEWVGRFNIVTTGTGSEPSPDWFYWASCSAASGHSSSCGGTVNQWWQGWGPIEDDMWEFYGLQGGGGGAIHSVWSPVCGNQINGVCPYWAQDAALPGVTASYTQTVPTWTFQTQSNYGSLETWSGNQSNPEYQTCMYLNNLKVLNTNGENCYNRSYLRNNGFLYADQQQMSNRRILSWWLGGYATDQNDYVNAIRVWSCPGWLTDPTCSVNGITQ